ncbi:HIT family protein [Candidatus Woesearchaeota archaeon]|nr:HIT family protein [Candidatus Woesearchaeota archaeon]
MADCVFCMIRDNKIPGTRVFEDSKVLAFLDIGPVNKGHTLVIPKEHYETLLDIPDGLLEHLVVTTKKIARAAMKAVDGKGVNVMISSYRAAGQLVPHAHFHVIPRHDGDGFRHWPQGRYESQEEAQKCAAKISANL